jgi:peroxiredoxin
MLAMPRFVRLLPMLALPFMAIGCNGADAIPQVDMSARAGYATAPIKDDAPANATAPSDFPKSFVDAAGNPVDLKTFLGRKVVLVVLRGIPRDEGGAFCPTCLAQAGSLMANKDEFSRRCAEVLVLFPGPTDRIGEFVQTARQKTPGEPPLSFRLLMDQECEACDRLGIRDNLAKPATYLLDTRGRVTYAYVGETSTDRPSVKAVLAQLDAAE